MLTPSSVASVDVLTNGQTLSAQAQRSALPHFAICPILTYCYQYHQLRLCARWPSSLSGVLPSSNAHALSYKGIHTSFTTGQYPPNFFP